MKLTHSVIPQSRQLIDLIKCSGKLTWSKITVALISSFAILRLECDNKSVSTLLAHVKINHGLDDHREGIALCVFSATHDNEDGCVRYEYWRGSESRTYYVLLSFQSFDDFMTHQVADYHHNTDFRDCFEDFNLEWVDPIENASPLIQSETSGETKEDRGEVWNNYVRNHSSEIPAWWLKQRD